MTEANSNPDATQKSHEPAIQKDQFLPSTYRDFADLITAGIAYILAHATRHQICVTVILS
jgi:hypothetical protein